MDEPTVPSYFNVRRKPIPEVVLNPLRTTGVERYQQLLANDFVAEFWVRVPLYQRFFSKKEGRELEPVMWNAWLQAFHKLVKVPFPEIHEEDREVYKLLAMSIMLEEEEPKELGDFLPLAPEVPSVDGGHIPLVLVPTGGPLGPRRNVRPRRSHGALVGLILASEHPLRDPRVETTSTVSFNFKTNTTPSTEPSRPQSPQPTPETPLSGIESLAEMEATFLQPHSSFLPLAKTRAIEDARETQQQVIAECKKKGKDPPPYVLDELIGKGSFGRVYKAKDMVTAKVVAIKIIDIDESDSLQPAQADSYGEFLKEVNALRILSEKNAKNINIVHDVLPVGKAMWMVIDFCAGGSVATLMKPNAPIGLVPKYIIVVLREVAVALKFCHENGIIHRDVKCANVLVTEVGNVQLCDFGIAGIIEKRTDKRSTIIGTPHWMAPELFSKKTSSYGTEVDIWAFGCMAFELATGRPPFANQYPDPRELSRILQTQTPRLEDNSEITHSDALKDIVAFCIQEDPGARPSIEDVQRHPYIFNTEAKYPASSLRELLLCYKDWERNSLGRQSLFWQNGPAAAQPGSSSETASSGWIFTSSDSGREVGSSDGLNEITAAHGPGATAGFDGETARPQQAQLPQPQARAGRRRPPSAVFSGPKLPIQTLFNANTKSNYKENIHKQYGPNLEDPAPELAPESRHKSDLKLRVTNESNISNTVISMDIIDLDDPGSGTLRQPLDSHAADEDFASHDFSRSALSDPADKKPDRKTMDWTFASIAPPASADPDVPSFLTPYNDPPQPPALSDPADKKADRKTMDWTFASMAPPASADPDVPGLPTSFHDPPQPPKTPGSGKRPTLTHHQTEPNGHFGGALPAPLVANRLSTHSLIDLDFNMPVVTTEYRPSTANSDAASTTSERLVSANPFEYEKHASLRQTPFSHAREPSLYVDDDVPYTYQGSTDTSLKDHANMSDFSASDAEGPNHDPARYDEHGYHTANGTSALNGIGILNGQASFTDEKKSFDSSSTSPSRLSGAQSVPRDAIRATIHSASEIPSLPTAPSMGALSGTATQDEMADEIDRMMISMSAQLSSFKNVFEHSDLVQKRGSVRRDNPNNISM